MTLSVGTRLGPYEILSPLGAGGMGEVYRARDTRLGRDVAVKVLPEDVAGDARALVRFETEARAVAALSHPNILALFDVGKEGSVSFVVTELLDGETLHEALGKGPLPLKKALDVGLQVAEGLAAAHGKGIVHRDVKPENVFLMKDGHAKLLDFGLARHEVSSREPSDTRSPTLAPVTDKGVVLGTVTYMSPEQARGETVDFRSDQFSLGVVLYEILTGKRPFAGASAAESLAATIRDEPEPLTKIDPKLPALLGWIVQRCLSKDPEERYSSTRDLAKELQNLRAHLSEAVSAKGAAPAKTAPLGRRVPLWVLAVVGAAAVALALLFAIRFVRGGAPPAPALSLSLSFPVEASPDIFNTSPLALTPDGKTLVYVGMKDTRPMLFVRRLDRDEIRPIPGTDGAALPFLSPDGLQVGFFAEGKLKKVALDGAPPITLCDARIPRGGSWGADGTIVFTPSAMSGLQRISSSGGEPRQVTTPDAAKGEKHLFPQILPDGEHVLFDLSDSDRTGGAAVVSLRTGVQKAVFEDAPYPRYLPTGHLAFTRPGSLFAVPFDLKNLEASGPPVPLLTDLVTNLNFLRTAEYAFSRDGTLVYVPTRQLQRTFVWVDRKGAVERIPFPPGGYEEVVLSPDGKQLATRVIEKSEKMTLLFGDLARGTLTRSTAEGSFQCLAWAPDGKRVAFGFKPAGGRGFFSAFCQTVDGSVPPERLTTESQLQTALPTSFSPDGSLALVQVIDYADTTPANTRWDIFVLPLGGEKQMRPFLKTRAKEELARFSPDGRWVAYRSDESGQLEIFVQPFPGPGPKWQVSIEGGSEPRWSPSGRELFYRQDDKVNRQNDKMMVVDVETAPTFRAGRPRVLFEGQFYDFGINCYDVTPDGSRFIMIKEDPAELGPAHVNVVLNWFDEVKRKVPGAK
jgi:eukaryotic-like serine/threonine-protein kinase